MNDTGIIYVDNDDNVILSVDRTNARIGIGTNDPTVTLDVTGNAKVTGNLTVTGDIGLDDITVDDATIQDLSVTGSLTISDTVNIVLSGTTGTKIGTATTQKIGFHNATPVIQQATTGTATGFTAGGGTTATHTSTFTGNSGTKAYTVGDIVLALKNLGLLAAS